jgi:hypothetical protein
MNRTFSSGQDLAAALEAAARKVGPTFARTVRHEAALLSAVIQLNATGRPGPNVITGRYRASWRTEVRTVPGGGQATVGTDAVQGPRLEWGFVGTDSLGRQYNQPPYAHVQPALAVFQPAFPKQILKAIEEAMK